MNLRGYGRPQMRSRAIVSSSLLSLIFGLLVLALTAAPAAAQKPPAAYGGKIFISDKKFPSQAKSVSAYFSGIKKNSKKQLWEDKQKKTWKVHFAAFFKRPLADIEVIVKLYDVSGGSRQMLASFEQFVDQRGQQALLSMFTLDRKQVGVNKQVLMVVEVKGQTVATGSFKILGEAERYTGKVDFSDEDTQGDDQE